MIDVAVNAVADAPTLGVQDGSGAEDTAIALDIQSVLTATDGSETLSITVSGVPEGAVLSAGTNNRPRSWTPPPDALDALTVPDRQRVGKGCRFAVHVELGGRREH